MNISITKLDRWLTKYDGLDENLRVTTLRVFLYIAQKGQIVAWDLTRDLELQQPQAHRALQRLTVFGGNDHIGKGLELVKRYPDPEQTKRFLYELTPVGKDLYNELIS